MTDVVLRPGLPETGALPHPACPLCHTPDPITNEALAAGEVWRCTRCGHTWSAVRLATAAAYARFVSASSVHQ